jgi:hypothetical protein
MQYGLLKRRSISTRLYCAVILGGCRFMLVVVRTWNLISKGAVRDKINRLGLKDSEPGSSVSTVSGCLLDDRAVEVRSLAETKGFFLYPLCPDRLWGPPSLLYNGYRGCFPRRYSAAGSWRWPLTPIYCRGWEWVGAIPPLRPSASVACSGTALAFFSYNTSTTTKRKVLSIQI